MIIFEDKIYQGSSHKFCMKIMHQFDMHEPALNMEQLIESIDLLFVTGR